MARVNSDNYQSYMKGANRQIDTHTREMYLSSSPTVQAGYGPYDSIETAHKVACYMFDLNDAATASTPCTSIQKGFTVAIENPDGSITEYQYKKQMPLGGYTSSDLEVKGVSSVTANDVSYNSSISYDNGTIGKAIKDTAKDAVDALSDAATNAGDIGTISNLETSAKQNLVSAINEVNSKATNADAHVGDLSALTTEHKTSTVAAINDVKAAIPTSMSSENITYNSSDNHTTGSIAKAMNTAEQSIISLDSDVHDLRDDVGNLSNLDTPAQDLVSAINSGVTSASGSATASSSSAAAAALSASTASGYYSDILTAMGNLGSGEAVAAQVAINQADIAGLKSNIVVDLSIRYTTSYANLSAALTALNSDTATDATGIKKGGVSIKFINSSTNKYEQWNLKASSWSTNESDWVSVTNLKAEDVSYGSSNVKDELDDINEKITDITGGEKTSEKTVIKSDFSNEGFINTSGSITAGASNIYTDFISLDDVTSVEAKVILNSQSGGAVSFYSGQNLRTIVSMVGSNTSSTSGRVNEIVNIDSATIAAQRSLGAKYFVGNARAEGDCYIKYVKTETVDGLEERIDGLEEQVDGLEERVDTIETLLIDKIEEHTYDSSYFTNKTNIDPNGVVGTSNNWRSTDYIECEGVTKIVANCLLSHGYNYKGLAFFDANKHYLGGYPLTAGSGTVANTLITCEVGGTNPIPEGTAYVICCTHPNIVSTAYIKITVESKGIESRLDDIEEQTENSKKGVESVNRYIIMDRELSINACNRPLKVFFLGNSFAVQSSQYFAKLCQSIGLSVVIGISYVGGATLQAYDQYYGKTESSSNTSAFLKYIRNEWVYDVSNPKSINIYHKLVDEDWDLVFMQQGSGSADTYTTYQPYANNLVDWIAETRLWQGKLAWLMPWAWTDARLQNYSTVGGSTTNAEMYAGIVSATNSLVSDVNFDIVSPNGAAIQKLYDLGYTFNDIYGASGDGQHLGTELAKFTVGYCLFRKIIPMYYKDVNAASVEYTDSDITAQIFADAKTAVEAVLNLF